MSNAPVEHIPVLSKKLAEYIRLPQDAVMVDATIGHGGHSLLFGQNLGEQGVLAGFDVDINSIRTAKSRLEELSCKVFLINSNFSEIAERLLEHGIKKADFILADLGVSSAQLADVEMGLSFQKNMPLDMRIDKRFKVTAADIINNTDEKSLADIIYKFGEDRASRRIARFIVQYRINEPIKTTGQLAKIVCRALSRPGKKRRSRIHPATRTFQALRIAVNNELDNLEALLEAAAGLLKENGFVAIISFHSLEDRLVKINFKQNKQDGIYEIITKKPINPSREEVLNNPRARSAKLRIARKVN